MKVAMLELSFSAHTYKPFIQEMRKHFDFEWVITYGQLDKYYRDHGFSPVLADPSLYMKNFNNNSNKELLFLLDGLKRRFNIKSFRPIFGAANAYKSGSIYASYDERRCWIYTLALVMALSDYLDKHEPQFVLQRYGAEIDRRIMRMLCDERGINSVFLDYVPFFKGIQPSRNEYSDCYDVKLRDVSKDNVRQYIANYQTGRVNYFQGVEEKSSIIKRMRKMFRDSYYAKMVPGYVLEMIKLLQKKSLRYKRKIIDCLSLKLRKSTIIHDRKILLYPMQTTVESTVTVRSQGYPDQNDIIRELSLHIPDEFVLLIKPHPHDLRAPNFRDFLSLYRLQNVFFVPGYVPMIDVLKESSIIITINSTAGFEALMLGVPVIQIGHSIYSREGLTYKINKLSEIGEAIAEVERFRPHKDTVEKLIEKWLSRAFRGWFNDGYETLVSDIKLFAELRSGKHNTCGAHKCERANLEDYH